MHGVSTVALDVPLRKQQAHMILGDQDGESVTPQQGVTSSDSAKRPACQPMGAWTQVPFQITAQQPYVQCMRRSSMQPGLQQ